MDLTIDCESVSIESCSNTMVRVTLESIDKADIVSAKDAILDAIGTEACQEYIDC